MREIMFGLCRFSTRRLSCGMSSMLRKAQSSVKVLSSFNEEGDAQILLEGG